MSSGVAIFRCVHFFQICCCCTLQARPDGQEAKILRAIHRRLPVAQENEISSRSRPCESPMLASLLAVYVNHSIRITSSLGPFVCGIMHGALPPTNENVSTDI